MMNATRILVIEDEPKIAQLIVDYLKLDGFEAEIVPEGTNAVGIIQETQPDFVILDLMLPGKDGLTICQEVRLFSEVPILMLTARVDEIDRLMGLNSGADDYVCKPFLPKEVVARVKTILRRVNRLKNHKPSAQTIEYAGIQLEPESFQCSVNGQGVELTPVEFRMLKELLSQPGRVFSREQLMQASYQDDRIVSDRTIDSHIKNLRKKIAMNDPQRERIHSIYGMGYKID
ncbi:response regulator [Shewanella gelidii]|uniref:DNA-binding response regulator n=1 Tax=Shewanella gelidii TaxID=1642821 RepID=A0A917JP97_9GAMM|nr:response regulator [Shewanella gelidii]MCL1097646.1 response regulator [Shewanella gelidii]GGI79917.1 DNA-binding response regulator [Shewanella gelidii]